MSLFVAALGDFAQDRSVSRRHLLWHEPQPSTEVASLLEAGAIADRRYRRARDDRADARHGLFDWARAPRPGRRSIGPRGRSRPHVGRRLPSDSGRRMRPVGRALSTDTMHMRLFTCWRAPL